MSPLRTRTMVSIGAVTLAVFIVLVVVGAVRRPSGITCPKMSVRTLGVFQPGWRFGVAVRVSPTSMRPMRLATRRSRKG